MAADLIFYNGKIFTGTGENGYRICSAAAIKDGRFLAVGDDAEILVLADENTYYAIHSVLETNGIKVACLDMLISHTKEESYFELMSKNVSEIANVLKTGI